MDNLTSEIKKRINEDYKSVREFAQAAGIPYTTLLTALQKGFGGTAVDTAIKVCTKLNISLEKICGIETTAQRDFLTKEEKALIKKYRSLDSYGKRVVDGVIDLEMERYQEFLKGLDEEKPLLNIENIVYMPLFDLPVSAGTGVFLDSERYEMLGVGDTPASRKATYAVRVSGDSMLPNYKDGDILLVCQQPTLEVGELGIFILNGEGYFKEYGGDCLISLNPAYDDIAINNDDSVYIKGKVVGKV